MESSTMLFVTIGQEVFDVFAKMELQLNLILEWLIQV